MSLERPATLDQPHPHPEDRARAGRSGPTCQGRELSDGTAQKLHVTVMKTLDKHGLPKTCLGLCTDGANSMSGNHNSLFSRLREDNNELVLVKCAGHSLDLVASKSMEAIPSAVEHLVGETHSFFAHSSCRQEF
ncbi:hypothetical protein HPB52_016747 [Rhipicephalus sanguineus]|uniref:DUF4371 domain-containing protein n=1 Tax=Rhipicephalus sanguineus TaxID=34632 RepID=A0A9D4Q9S1_RHISA|nr:hypothetical protein HPB52_016747 [Rhipicephalus sanguineus]